MAERQAPAIEQAIDDAAQRQAALEPKLIGIGMLPAIRLDPEGSLDVLVSQDDVAVVMVLDPSLQGWRAVLLPAGSRWELRQSSAAPKVWRPDA